MDPARHVWYGMVGSTRIEETMMNLPLVGKPCPGCLTLIRPEHMCCRQCWERTPVTYRRAYIKAYASKNEQPGVYTLQKLNVVNWLKHHRATV